MQVFMCGCHLFLSFEVFGKYRGPKRQTPDMIPTSLLGARQIFKIVYLVEQSDMAVLTIGISLY
jgi:hypothetical protein